jgi:hypothetical protein
MVLYKSIPIGIVDFPLLCVCPSSNNLRVPRSKDTIRGFPAYAKRAQGVHIDIAHSRCFSEEVLLGILEYAEGVDPNVSNTEGSTENDDVLEALWYQSSWYV